MISLPFLSFYGSDAINAKNATYCMNLIKNSDALTACEWAISSEKPSDWSDAIQFSILMMLLINLHKRIGNNKHDQ